MVVLVVISCVVDGVVFFYNEFFGIIFGFFNYKFIGIWIFNFYFNI